MELITIAGLLCVAWGFWVEFSDAPPLLSAISKWKRNRAQPVILPKKEKKSADSPAFSASKKNKNNKSDTLAIFLSPRC